MDASPLVGMRRYRDRVMGRVLRERVPGLFPYFDANNKERKEFWEKLTRAEAAFRDVDEPMFEHNLDEWAELVELANQRLAEEHRLSRPPEEWDLRFVRWMKRLIFIRFGSPLGEFYLVPRRPRYRPKASHWYTAEQMMDFIASPEVIEMIKVFGCLPVQPEDVALKPQEKHLHYDPAADKVWGAWWPKKNMKLIGPGVPLRETIPIEEGSDE